MATYSKKWFDVCLISGVLPPPLCPLYWHESISLSVGNNFSSFSASFLTEALGWAELGGDLVVSHVPISLAKCWVSQSAQWPCSPFLAIHYCIYSLSQACQCVFNPPPPPPCSTFLSNAWPKYCTLSVMLLLLLMEVVLKLCFSGPLIHFSLTLFLCLFALFSKLTHTQRRGPFCIFTSSSMNHSWSVSGGKKSVPFLSEIQ